MSKEFCASESRYDGKLKYRRSGSSGILLPEVSLGLWKNFGKSNPISKSQEMIEYAFNQGITHFDLANNYGPPYGSSEETFGEIMSSSMQAYRDELFVSTKAGYDMWAGPYGNWGSRKYLISSLNQSLKRMKLEYVDLFYSHRYDPNTPIEETLQALVDIVRSGKALYAGISRWPLEATKRAFDYLEQRDVRCLAYQGRINLLDRSPEEEGILELCRERKVGFVGFSPLSQGLLTSKYLDNMIPSNSRMAINETLKKDMLTPELIESLRNLNKLATSRGETLAQMAMRWILDYKEVTTVIVGASSTKQLCETIACSEQSSLTSEEKEKIEQILAPYFASRNK